MKQPFVMFIIILLIFYILFFFNNNKNEKFKNIVTKKYYYFDLNQRSGVYRGYFKWDRPLQFFKNDNMFEYKKMTYKKIFSFLNEIKNTKNKTYILFFNDKNYVNQYKLLEYSKELNKNITIIPLGSSDWWFNTTYPGRKYNKYIQNVFKYDRLKYVLETDIKILGEFLNQDLKKYKHNIIQFALHNCYDYCFVKFNDNPINKILVSGSLAQHSYPERKYITRFKNVDVKNNRNGQNDEKNYAKFLNKYLCCFASSVYPENLSLNKKRTNSHCILLKNYEILGSGSLLLNPLIEKPYLEKIGLIEDINCMFVDMTNDKKIQAKIDFILDSKNRRFIDKVRKAGQNYGKKNLTSKKKFEELKNIILKL